MKTESEKLQAAAENFDRLQRLAKTKLNEFADAIRENPLHAMQWADANFERAAAFALYGELAAACRNYDDNDKTMADLRANYTRAALQHARQNNRSSSNSSNQCDDAVRALLAEVVQDYGPLSD